MSATPATTASTPTPGLSPPPAPIAPVLARALQRVRRRFDEHLVSDLDVVNELCAHVERYRGKMLRPTLVFVSALACRPDRGAGAITDEHVTVGAVLEMIHMATLVHDDVLDEADLRRRGRTVNALRGNEIAVILGDHLLSRAFHLCSSLDSQATALRVGEVTSTVCEGEMLQLAHRADLHLDEPTYFEIVGRKTAALIGVACELGALHAGADERVRREMYDAGHALGCAFQIQDDVLDLVGDERVVGKSLGRDLAKGKLTLPIIRHASMMGGPRDAWLDLLRRAESDEDARREAARRLAESGAIDSARDEAGRLVDQAGQRIGALPDSDARAYMLELARQVVDRAL